MRGDTSTACGWIRGALITHDRGREGTSAPSVHQGRPATTGERKRGQQVEAVCHAWPWAVRITQPSVVIAKEVESKSLAQRLGVYNAAKAATPNCMPEVTGRHTGMHPDNVEGGTRKLGGMGLPFKLVAWGSGQRGRWRVHDVRTTPNIMPEEYG